MLVGSPNFVVHLELQIPNQANARSFYAELFGWQPELIPTASSTYLALKLGAGLSVGIVACPAERALWLPYVEVGQIAEAIERAPLCGATILLEAREGPGGWRSVISTPAGGSFPSGNQSANCSDSSLSSRAPLPRGASLDPLQFALTIPSAHEVRACTVHAAQTATKGAIATFNPWPASA